MLLNYLMKNLKLKKMNFTIIFGTLRDEKKRIFDHRSLIEFAHLTYCNNSRYAIFYYNLPYVIILHDVILLRQKIKRLHQKKFYYKKSNNI